MKNILISALLLTTVSFSHGNFIKHTFHKTIKAESHGKYDAVNLNDLGKPAYGYVQFRGKYAKILERKLKFTKYSPLKYIKRQLRSKKGIKLQKTLFKKRFVNPILKLACSKKVTNKKVIEILVDWRVNGMPKKYCKYINKHTTVQQIINLRVKYYKHLRRKNPKRYSKSLYLSWIKRLKKFKV